MKHGSVGRFGPEKDGVKAPPAGRRGLRWVDFKATSGFVAYEEVIVTVPFDLVLHLDVLSGDLIRYVPTTCDEAATTLEMPSPELLCQFPMFAQQLAGCFPLSRWRNLDTETWAGTDTRRRKWSSET